MNNYNQVTPLKLGSGSKAQANNDASMSSGIKSQFQDSGSSSVSGKNSIDTVQFDALKSCGSGYIGFQSGRHNSSFVLQQQHNGGTLSSHTIPQSTIAGNAVKVPDNLCIPDYSLFFSPKDAYANKPPGLINWIDRQYARATQEKFNEVKMKMFISQANKLISKAYATNKEWKNDWFQQPHVPVFSRGGLTPPMQLQCEMNETAYNNKRKLVITETVLDSPSPAQSVAVGKNLNSSNKAGFTQQPHLPRSGLHDKKSLTEQDRKRRRLERFAASGSASKKNTVADDDDFSNLNATSNHFYKFDKNNPVVGRCNTLEKRYLRLTSEPDPNNVRPLHILERAFQFIMEKRQKQASYAYLCDQFKSIRQDLKVQLIENDFTLKVYQTHAKLALENGDLGEYNQCQGSISELFEQKHIENKHFAEFMSYRILYHLLTEDHASINEIRLKLLVEYNDLCNDPMIELSLNMAQAQSQGDYHSFMKLYGKTEGPMKSLINEFIKRERLKALKTMCCAYNQLRLSFLVSELSLKDEDETFQFLTDFDLFDFVVLPEGDADTMYLNFKECRSTILSRYNKPVKVDIKGQK
ncbi:Thp3p Ecym_7163 [Eremothecium cymbalariae DBVPG|uniref:SAC3/GANP/THP3 conserved domain-containing protein n=1 Tax=Eremothecium cymbalariae (strain CBS 270.75 / DBVPG 7215 / KCTC 17166 / NRRL Y-17582) TaxID=931890 RepID=G8JVZ6_ERECY|nr:hypothetical protein Ecym_7163 [Eremothecium cymbalariae DBVPG\